MFPHITWGKYQAAAKYNYEASGLESFTDKQQRGTAWLYVTPSDQGLWNEDLSFASGTDKRVKRWFPVEIATETIKAAHKRWEAYAAHLKQYNIDA